MEDEDLIVIGRDLYGSFPFPKEGKKVKIPDDPPKEIIELGIFEGPSNKKA